MKRPTKYALPLRTRADITNFLVKEVGAFERRSYDNTTYNICFNVKLGLLDLSFETMWAKKIEYETDLPSRPPAPFNDADYKNGCRAVYVELFGGDDLGETNQNTGWYEEREYSVRQSFLDQDHVLFNGKRVKAEFSFNGRSSGWLVLEKFEGFKLNGTSGEFEETLNEMSFVTLRNLYELVVMYGADYVKEKGPDNAVIMECVTFFFEHECRDVPLPGTLTEAALI